MSTECSEDDCTKPRAGKHRLCSMHRARKWRHGNTTTVLKPGVKVQFPKYRTLHWQIDKARGLASTHACAHCGLHARHWAYDHTDPAPLEEGGLLYSLDVNRYKPLCVACHMDFDSGA